MTLPEMHNESLQTTASLCSEASSSSSSSDSPSSSAAHYQQQLLLQLQEDKHGRTARSRASLASN